MSIPSYGEIYDYLHGEGLEPLPVPNKRPTRKGLGRYARDCILQRPKDEPATIPRWQRTWFACTISYHIMLECFSVRLPSDTFLHDRIRVEQDLYRNDTNDTTSSWGVNRATRMQAYRWATRRS